VEITNFARKKKAFIIAITDNPLSPIGQLADSVSLCGLRKLLLFGSHASTLVILDCLIGGAFSEAQERSVEALMRLENTLKGCDVWIQ